MGIAVVDQVASYPRILRPPVQPYTTGAASCCPDPADVVVPDNGIDGEMEFNSTNFRTAVLFPVGDVLNEIAFNDASNTTVGANDTGLTAFPDGVVTYDMMPEGVDVGKLAVIPVVFFGGADTNPDIFDIADGAILDDPAIPEVGADSAFLETIRWCPVGGRMPDVEAVDDDMFKPLQFWENNTFTDVDFGKLLIGVDGSEVRPYLGG